MSTSSFFKARADVTLGDVVNWAGAQVPEGIDLTKPVKGLASLSQGGSSDIVFLDNPKYLDQLAQTQALACLISERHAPRLPANVIPLVTAHPYHAAARVLSELYPQAMRPTSMFEAKGIAPGAFVHPEARIEEGVTIDPGAVIGPRAQIGEGSVIGAHAVIGPDVCIGRHCSIGSQTTISCALIGNHVIIHPGTRIGQDGFGFAMGPKGHLKVPQVGRVIIQDWVEIGANSTIDRGAINDTVIGEGTKIDNLVQIAHNVMIGRHSVIVSQVGISGSTEIDDFVAIGGQAGITGHLKIGRGAQIAAQSGVMTDVPPEGRWGGAPAQPIRQFFRSVAALQKLSQNTEEKN